MTPRRNASQIAGNGPPCLERASGAGSTGFAFTVPLRLRCGPNARLYWAARAARVKVERGAVKFCAPPQGEWADLFERGLLNGGWRVSLTRLSPRKVDSDNLQGLFKAVRDEVARLLGVDDGSELVSWEYSQEKHKGHSVIIGVEALP